VYVMPDVEEILTGHGRPLCSAMRRSVAVLQRPIRGNVACHPSWTICPPTSV